MPSLNQGHSRSRSRSRSCSRSRNGGIGKLDFDSHRKPPSTNDGSEAGTASPHGLLRDDESFLSEVVEGVIERDRRKMRRSVMNLCAGSITAYSLYGHLFLTRLHYTQGQVNVISIAAELGMYLPVPLFGYLCDRYSPRPLSLLSGIFFGFGYLLAAFTYHQGPPMDRGGNGWSYGIMVLAFVGVGMGTSCMYLSAVTTCAKNFGRGKHKGLALALPIASFGLSGMWQSQVGSQLLYEAGPQGEKGDVDVFRFILFLGITLLAVGIIGAVGLQVVNEEELIDEAVDEMERSGVLEDSAFFQRSILHDSNGYGTIEHNGRSISAEHQFDDRETASLLSRNEEEDERKKTWLLNAETRLFLVDHTMWFLAGGFFLVTGPGEAFINNLGTIIGTLYPPPLTVPSSNSAATHVSIVAVTSTIARLLTGTLSDILAPVSPPPTTSSHHHNSRNDHTNGTKASSMLEQSHGSPHPKRFTISRLTFLLSSTLLLAIGQLLLATGLCQSRPSLFPLVSALVGLGYGAIFSLVPIIISVVWGVNNFGTNWGIVAMVPAGGAAVWGGVYSKVYEWGASSELDHFANLHLDSGNVILSAGSVVANNMTSGAEDVLCYGAQCYQSTFWAMAVCSVVAIGLWAWAWRGKGGWVRRGIAV